MIDKKPRGTWFLCQAYDVSASKKNQVQTFSEKSGFRIFRDRAVVVFYTNDLKEKPNQSIEPHTDPHTIECVHGTADLHRWLGSESMRRTVLKAPACIVAYNLFMNAVSRVDQVHAASPMMRKEHTISMRVLTFLIDSSLQNAFAIYRTMGESAIKTFCDFKLEGEEMLCTPLLQEEAEKSP